MVKLILTGMLIGVANVIPGVSGGTIAVVLGVFDKLIDAVNNFYKDFKKHFAFIIPLGIGAGLGILLFSRLVKYCLTYYSLPTNLFFAGLVAGSLPVIYKEASKKGRINIVTFLLGILAVLLLSLAKGGQETELITSVNAGSAPILFGAGAIAAAAMVVPGISGSFVLILLGYYNTVITAVADFNIPVLTVTAIGIIAGVLIISKIIEILLKKAYTVTYSAILGLIAASFFSILTDKAVYETGVTPVFIIVGILLGVVGFLIAVKLGE